MIISMRKWLERLKFVMLFLILTYIISRLFVYISVWIQPDRPYKQPAGSSVKVFQGQEDYYGEHGSMEDRLRLFYWYGE